MEPSRASMMVKMSQGQSQPHCKQLPAAGEFGEACRRFPFCAVVNLNKVRQSIQSSGKKAARRVHCCIRLLLVNSTTYGVKISVGVIMGFRFMAGMVMVMRPVVTRVLMVVCLGGPGMGVLMEMFVQVFVGMAMGMLMAVHFAVMGMFVGVRMSVVMRMQMLVFVLSFHN